MDPILDSIKFQRAIRQLVLLLVLLLIAASSPSAQAQPANEPIPAAGKADERGVEYWIEQLASDHYLRRETAQQKLIRAGDDAVPALEKVLDESDLETTELVIRALGEIAMAQPPDDDSGAWAALERIATKRAGSKANRAKLVSDEVNDYRSVQARLAIVAAGVFIGTDDFVIQAISETHLIIQIDETWRGDLKSLDWLRWVRGIRFARVKGDAVNREVLRRLVKMPDLKTIALVDATVDVATITMLSEMRSIHSLELRYVPLDEPLADAIASLPLRSSLSLIGTDLPSAKVAALRATLPGLKIEYKQGGYLGVAGSDLLPMCQINRVLPDSAAEQAGLQVGDVILRIGETEIRQFSDLQAKISAHHEGDSLEIDFSRKVINPQDQILQDKLFKTTVVLGKQKE